jgi:polysaccharide biosynthesis protein PslH
VRILVVSPRFPETPGNGDQSRAFAQIVGLADRHELIVVTAGAPSSERADEALRACAEVHAVRAGTLARLSGALAALARGRPAQVGWMTPGAARALAAELARRSDVTLVITSRGLPTRLPGPVVLDHVDPFSRAMVMRSRLERNPLLRLAARLEGLAFSFHEGRCARWLAAQTVVAPVDAAALPSPPEPIVIPQGWRGPIWEEPAGHRRDIDVIFTGRMNYPPNRDAARRLAHDIVPRLRERRAGVRVYVVGRFAASLGLRGVEVASDVEDMHSYLRRAKVAVAPLRAGTGSPTKLIEAAAAGAAVVAPAWATASLGMTAPSADTAEEFVDVIDRLLGDDAGRAACARTAAEALGELRTDELVAKMERVLVAAAAS